MAQEAAVPAGFKATIQKMIDDSIAKYARSGSLQNSSITGGQGLRVGPGSKMVVQHPNGNTLMLMGAYADDASYDMPDGSPQPMALVYRSDGSLALGMYDPQPGVGGFQQFLALFDRGGNIIVSDDTDSGQGLARPYVPATFYRNRYADWVTTTSTSFDSLFVAVFNKQHPKLFAQVQASNDTAGAAGEVQILVNGAPFGSVASTTFGIATYSFGPLPVAGAHMASLKVEVQARVTSGGGGVRVEPTTLFGAQS